jgi:PilZ domain-containing protein
METGPEGNGRERREDERRGVSLEAWWESLSGRQQARVSDLSMGGCYVDSHAPVELDALIVFAIRRPDGSWLELRGRVVARDPGGFSLAFTYLTDEEQQELRRLGAI